MLSWTQRLSSLLPLAVALTWVAFLACANAVFLDVAMPGANGTEVLRRIVHRPFVMFTTAFSEAALTLPTAKAGGFSGLRGDLEDSSAR